MKPFLSLRFWIGMVISLLCLILAANNVPLAEVGHSLAIAGLLWLVPGVVFQSVTIVARAQRWVVLLGNGSRLSDSFWSQSIGYLFTNIFPLRLGEPARVIVMSERSRLPVVQVAATALVERLLDVAAVVLMLALVLPWLRVPGFIAQAGLTFGILVLLSMVALLLLARFSDRAEGLLQSVCRRCSLLPADSIVARWRELVTGLLPLMHRQTAMQVAGWTAASWAFSILTYWSILRAFRDDGAVLEATFLMVAVSLAVSVPSSPGFIGVFQLVGQQALVLPFGTKYDAASALAIALTVHLTYYLFTTPLGVVGLWKLGRSFSTLGRAVKLGLVTR